MTKKTNNFKYKYADLVNFVLHITNNFDDHEPYSYKEVISYQKYSQWMLAINKEIKSLYKNRIWELVKPSQG